MLSCFTMISPQLLNKSRNDSIDYERFEADFGKMLRDASKAIAVYDEMHGYNRTLKRQ